jgi:hypothetical protein
MHRCAGSDVLSSSGPAKGELTALLWSQKMKASRRAHGGFKVPFHVLVSILGRFLCVLGVVKVRLTNDAFDTFLPLVSLTAWAI